jgi:cell wall integrity and stress response component
VLADYLYRTPDKWKNKANMSRQTTDAGDDMSTTTTQPPVFSTVTADGTVKTVTVTPVPTDAASSPNAAPITSATSEPSHGLSAGAAAGIAVAVLAAFLFVGGAVAWLFFKRRRARREEQGGAGNYSSQRGSSAGMTGTPRTGEVSETRYYMGSESVAESSRRRSMLMPVDPRLDPYAKGIYPRDDNRSHDSVNTIRDDHDYSRKIQEPSRVLRATNPDPDLE